MKAEIDLGAIERNFARVKNAAGKPLILMCKADAYGHGAAQVVRAVSAKYYGVATEEEGVPIRALDKEVLVTAPSFSALALCRRYDMIPLIGDFDILKKAVACGVKRCHIKVNSGMNRLGFTGGKECYAAARLLSSSGVRVEGIATHYKEDSDQNVQMQNLAFQTAIKAIKSGLHDGKNAADRVITSVTGSGALFAKEFDYLRIGLAAYGYHTGYATAGLGLEPAMRITSEVIKVKSVAAGNTLGYSGNFTAPKRLKAYTVLGGYGDGIACAEKGRSVLAAGRRLKIAAVSMDSFEMTSDRVDLKVGTRVIILSKRIDAAYIAAVRGTIPYEVLVGYDVPRMQKVYVR